MTYQQATYEFSEALVNLYHQAYAANERLGIHFKAGIMTQSELEKVLQTTPTFVKVLDQHLVSSVSFRLPWSDNPSPFFLPHLGWVATNPHFQGQGHAKSLISEIIDNYILKELKAPAVTLGTALEHPWLIDAYEKMGFRYLGEKSLFSDHKTVYLIKTFNQEALLDVKDEALQTLLKGVSHEF